MYVVLRPGLHRGYIRVPVDAGVAGANSLSIPAALLLCMATRQTRLAETVTYRVTTEVLTCPDRETAIATATARLAREDATASFGLEPSRVTDVRVRGDGDGPTQVTLEAVVPVTSTQQAERFATELAQNTRVTKYERVA